MEYLDRLILDPPESAQEKEDDPEKMDDDDDIHKYLVQHFSRFILRCVGKGTYKHKVPAKSA
jgi:hypothetical protein